LAREGLSAVLSQGGYDIVGLAASGEEAIELATRLEPDIVLMDVRLGAGIDGLEATRRIVAAGLNCRVIMLTLHETPAYVREALSAGAAGYVLKEAAIEDLRGAIDQVMAGHSALPIELLNAAMRSHAPSARRESLDQILTRRELEVVERIALGLTNKQIARELNISPATVKVHVERLIGKLGVADRTQAAVLAVQLGAGGQ
jgi:DNA-binding NarL/FixJ family response regulator